MIDLLFVGNDEIDQIFVTILLISGIVVISSNRLTTMMMMKIRTVWILTGGILTCVTDSSDDLRVMIDDLGMLFEAMGVATHIRIRVPLVCNGMPSGQIELCCSAGLLVHLIGSRRAQNSRHMDHTMGALGVVLPVVSIHILLGRNLDEIHIVDSDRLDSVSFVLLDHSTLS